LRLVLEENFAFRYYAISLFIFVGVAGFEPATSCSQRGEKGYYFLLIFCVRALKILVFPKVINFSVC
jgi:hypothetical protein